jgi:hypothetical protein
MDTHVQLRILGTDPGLATGIAIYNTDTCKVEYVKETPDGIYGYQDYFLGLRLETDYSVVENFTLRSSNKFTADLHGVEIIGWLKGEGYWGKDNPEPSQHMTLTRLRQKKDNYADSVITKMMKEAGFKIGKGHTRMALSVAVWYAAMRLKHIPTLEMLKAKEDSGT